MLFKRSSMLKSVGGSLHIAQTKLLLSPTIKQFLKRKETHPVSSLGERAVHDLSGVIFLVQVLLLCFATGPRVFVNEVCSDLMRDLEAADYFIVLKRVVVASGFPCPCHPKHVWVTICLLCNCSHPATA